VAVALFWGGYTMSLAGTDPAATEEIAAELLEQTERRSLQSYHAQGQCLFGLCRLRDHDPDAGEKLIADGIEGLVSARYEVFCPISGAELARSKAAGGRVNQGLADIARVETDERHANHWNVPEIQRIKGEVLSMKGDQAGAEAQFSRALDLANRHGALGWALRAASSLARLRREQSRNAEALETLVPVYERLTEGFETADLRTASQLLDEMR
jgi:hypothetical protein